MTPTSESSFPRKRESMGGAGRERSCSSAAPHLDSRFRGNDVIGASSTQYDGYTPLRGNDEPGTSVPDRVKDAAIVMDVLRRATTRLAEAGCATPRLDAEILLMEVLGWSREDLYRSPETTLDASETERFEALVARRERGEPVAYLIGKREFRSLDFTVTPDVLIPRPETEHLVEAVVDFLASRPGPQRILDLGTGSGAIAVSVAKECPEAEVWATDVSAPALAVARENARRHGVERRIHLFHGDLCAPARDLPGYLDAVVSNPPYIPTREMTRLPRDVRDWEPSLALDGGVDGMGFHRRIAEEGIPLLREGGLLAVEIGADLGDAVCELFRAHRDIREIRMLRDYAELPRVVAGERMRVSDRAGHGH